jgi:hypothetical protein
MILSQLATHELSQEPRCTRSTWGMCIRHEVNAMHDELDAVIYRVEYGVADTFFTCPAKARVAGKSEYGFITVKEDQTGFSYHQFVRVADQKQAKAAYRASIQF